MNIGEFLGLLGSTTWKFHPEWLDCGRHVIRNVENGLCPLVWSANNTGCVVAHNVQYGRAGRHLGLDGPVIERVAHAADECSIGDPDEAAKVADIRLRLLKACNLEAQ